MKQTQAQTPSKNAGQQEWDIYCQLKQEEEHREFELLKAENRKFKLDNEKLQAKLTKAHERIEQILLNEPDSLEDWKIVSRDGHENTAEILAITAEESEKNENVPEIVPNKGSAKRKSA